MTLDSAWPRRGQIAMHSAKLQIAGLETTVIRATRSRGVTIVLLHGFTMSPDDLSPFATALGLACNFAIPRAPLAVPGGGFAWWDVNAELRAHALGLGPRDLAQAEPAGRSAARRQLVDWLQDLPPELNDGPLVLAGFSQGGMLAADSFLMEELTLAGLVLMSSSRIAVPDWSARLHLARGLPVFVSHGDADPDLAFSAGQELARAFENGGAIVTFTPFSGGHEIPLKVWRALKSFLGPICDARTAALDTTAG